MSEPLGDLAGAWNEVPESSYGVVREGQDELRPFTPRPSGIGNSATRPLTRVNRPRTASCLAIGVLG